MIDTSVTTTTVLTSPDNETTLSPSTDNVTVQPSEPTLTTIDVSVDEVVITESPDLTTDVTAPVVITSVLPSGNQEVVVYADSPSITNVTVDDQQNVTLDTTVVPPALIEVPAEQIVAVQVAQETAVINTIDQTPVAITIAPEQPVQVSIADSTTNVIATTAAQGPQGAHGLQGIPGPPGGTQLYNTSAAISQYSVVSTDSNAGIVHANCNSRLSLGTVVGIAIVDYLSGETASPLSSGVVENLLWTFVPGNRVFVGNNGQAVQILPIDAIFQQVVGTALSPTKLLINIMAPILLA